jgi:hypothetical protein
VAITHRLVWTIYSKPNDYIGCDDSFVNTVNFRISSWFFDSRLMFEIVKIEANYICNMKRDTFEKCGIYFPVTLSQT